jgi:hypothetical protein
MGCGQKFDAQLSFNWSIRYIGMKFQIKSARATKLFVKSP